MPAVDRVLARVVCTPGGCWLFEGARNREGYGLVSEGGKRGKMRLAHRVVYEAHVGPVPAGMVLDHVYARCTHRHCVNPAHLEPVTVGENNRRMHAAGRGNRDTSVALAARLAKAASRNAARSGP